MTRKRYDPDMTPAGYDNRYDQELPIPQPVFPRRRVFTFGAEHQHPLTGEPLKGCYIVLEETELDGARKTMFQHFGRNWSCEYTPEQFNKRFEQRGRAGTEIDLNGDEVRPDAESWAVAGMENLAAERPGVDILAAIIDKTEGVRER